MEKEKPKRKRKRVVGRALRAKQKKEQPVAWWYYAGGGAALLVLLLLLNVFFDFAGDRLRYFNHSIERYFGWNAVKPLSVAGYNVCGIDVSHYQAEIDWPQVKASEVNFAFMKATEGEEHRDRHFQKHWLGAKQQGILRGAYHFYLPAKDAAIQAQNFMEVVKLEFGDLPPVLDVEVTNHRKSEEIREGVKLWLELVEAKYKIKPIIYTNHGYYQEHLAGHFDDYPLWVAHYNDDKDTSRISQNEWLFWQHTQTGKLNGIKGKVDLNVFKGSLEDLQDLCYIPEEMQ